MVGAKRSDAKARASRPNRRLDGRPPKNATTRRKSDEGTALTHRRGGILMFVVFADTRRRLACTVSGGESGDTVHAGMDSAELAFLSRRTMAVV